MMKANTLKKGNTAGSIKTPAKKGKSSKDKPYRKPQKATVGKASSIADPSPPSFPVVAIGASAGGLEAVTLLLRNLSPTTGMAFIYVQHLSPDHKSMLTSLLSKVTTMVVQEIDDMEQMKPDNVYIIPYNKEIKVTDGHIKLIPRPKNKLANNSIDVLFSSLALARKENVIGIVLSGSASDGTAGLKDIKEAGGITFAQDDGAKFTSMPHSAIAAGVVDFVLTPKAIALRLNWISKHPFIIHKPLKKAPEDDIENNNPDLKIILQLIHQKLNVDFSRYKMNTIKRRMLRRMLINKVKTLQAYANLITQKKDELDLLFQDLLIHVTEFFRDTETFLFLKKSLFPKLLEKKSSDETLRIWVPACATGEEVYSIAMILRELQGNKNNHIPFQIFASDLSAKAIDEARSGQYTAHQIKNISPKRLQQFFTKANGKYRISKSLRDVCIFAPHNLLSDPPFSRMDFISCRNLLIYLDVAAQKKTLATLNYALNEGGCLMLGKSESIGSSEELFTPVNKKFKLFVSKKNPKSYSLNELRSRKSLTQMPEKRKIVIPEQKKSMPKPPSDLGAVMDSLLLTHHLPASVLINHDLDILQFRGATELYLKHTAGKASFNILRMAKPEIAFALRNAIHHAFKTKRPFSKKGVEIFLEKNGSSVHLVDLEITPVKMDSETPLLLIVFKGQNVEIIRPTVKGQKKNTVLDRRILKLEEEISAAHADMGSITRDQEIANEELQSANEEIVSSNEELQSLNEELETSKEEIESTNEELTTSNQELSARNLEVEELYSYYETILLAIQEPMLVLDRNMRIKTANKSFYRIFKVTEEESIGVSLYRLGNNQWNIPRLRELLEEIVPKNMSFHNFEVEHDFPVIGYKYMLLNAHRIINQSHKEELIVLTILDITEVRRLSMQLQLKEKKVLEKELEFKKSALSLIEASNKRYNMMLMQSPFAFAVLKGKKMIIHLANDSMKEMWGKGSSIEGKSLYKVLPEIKEGPVFTLLEQVLATGVPFHGYELKVPLKRKGNMEDVFFNFVYQPYFEADETISGVTIIAQEVTSHVVTKEELIEARTHAERKTRIAEDAMKSKQQFLSNMSHEIRTPMNAIIGFTKVVLKTELTPKQHEYLTAIQVSGDTLIALINDILDLAKVDSGKMVFEQIPFNLSESIASIFHLFEPKVQESETRLEKVFDPAIPNVLVGDPLRLRQIILNLMSNAIKFTCKGEVALNVKLLSENQSDVLIEFVISDTGIGIPEDKLETIFENFQQVRHDNSRMYGGTGLGLAIVKQLVESQGGQVSVKSILGKGTTFRFELGFRKTEATIQNEEHSIVLEAKLKGLRVLVVEDVMLNQLLMKTFLDEFGFATEFAANGKIAIEKLQQGFYDIILMDLQMPVMDGFETTSYIRDTMRLSIPIIALTADVTTIDVEKCRAIGMNDYLSKPIEEKLLYDKIAALVNKGRLNAHTPVEVRPQIKKKTNDPINLTYLRTQTASDPKMMTEMIGLMLKQTPAIMKTMTMSLKDKDWPLLSKSVHKLIPTLTIMGINKETEQLAITIQNLANKKEQLHDLPKMVAQLKRVCSDACRQLEVINKHTQANSSQPSVE